MFRIKQ